MSVQHAINNPGARIESVPAPLGTQVLRLRESLDRAVSYAQSQVPLIRSHWDSLLDWVGQVRERLQRIDLGARMVQGVGAAVVLGTLYVAIWGVGPNQTPQPVELVASRTAPIGTLTLQESKSPQVAEQVSPAEPAVAPM